VIEDLLSVPLHETQFYKEVFQMGLESGRQKAREWERNLVLRLLARRCGELAIEQTTQIRSLPIDQLENLGEALLDFTGMADLELWLKANVGE
jgi:predicted transposase YdaD